MTDLSVIILTKNEQQHIKRCLERLMPLAPRQIFMVDCFSTDETKNIVNSFLHRTETEGQTCCLTGKIGQACFPRTSGAFNPNLELQLETPTKSSALQLQLTPTTIAFVEHSWPGNQAAQFNWALENLPIEGQWILRLDADEYLFPDTVEEVKGLLPNWDGEKVTEGGLPHSVTSLSLSRARYFCDRKVRFGNPEIELVRFFKFGFGCSSQSEMDEHIVTSEGVNYKLKGKFVDHSLISMDEWREKHRNYAKREARMAVSGNANANKRMYYKLPPYLRAFAYFSYRYFFRLGFLDGIVGWRWHFWQGLWYRWIVDGEISKLRKMKLMID